MAIKLSGLLITAWSLCCFAQESAPPVIRSTVRQVLVPVVVTDKSGHYITGLGREDFNVSEDGVPQKIVAFDRSPVVPSYTEKREDGHPQGVPPTGNPATIDSPKRTYLICLDALHSDFSNFVQVRRALKKFFAEEQPGDSQYALIALGRQLHVIVDSTRDPSVILAAIDSKALFKTIQDSESANIARQSEDFLHAVGAWCARCACTNQSMDMANPWCPTLKSQVKTTLFSFSERTAILNRDFLEQLAKLVDAMARMPTRRTLLFISDGFNRYPGQELYSILRGYGINDPLFKFNPRDLQPDLDAVLRKAVRYNIRFYTIDSRGLYTDSSVPGSGQDASSRGAPMAVTQQARMVAWFNGDAMAQLARETGGLFFENNNDLLKGIRRAFADGREEYVLAYVPSNPALDGKFRHISVTIKDQKAHVAAKAGYWATP